MNRELAEVRRYWPRAKQHKFGNYSAVPNWRKWYACLFPWEDGWEIGVGEVDGSTSYRHAPTIAEAMRAAGFGTRPCGEYASKLKRARTVLLRRGSYVAIVTLDWPPQLADRQRPRKGARLGERKRAGWDKEETRHFAQWREWEGRP